jgi:Domain of unknown function (DUF5668)
MPNPMNCATHFEVAALTVCANCLQPFCSQCLVRVGERQLCTSCLARNSGPPPRPKTVSAPSAKPLCAPGAAFALGLIPGVGAICNGEYLKAFVHVMIFGSVVSLPGSSKAGSFEPLFGLMTAAFCFYMPLEAYHSAKRSALRAAGYRMEDRTADKQQENLWTGVILTAMGCLLFMNEWVEGFLEGALKFWPVVLIGFGAYKIWGHLNRENPEGG